MADEEEAAEIARSDSQPGAISNKNSAISQSESESSEMSGTVAAAARRRSSDPLDEGDISGGDGASTSEEGKSRTRIAQAPNVERNLDFGAEDVQQNHQINPVQSGIESTTTEVVRRAADSLSGGAVLGAASKVVAASMSSLPLLSLIHI